MKKKQAGMKELLKYCRRYIPALVAVVLLGILSVCLTVYGTTYLKTLTNYINEAAGIVKQNPSVSMREVIDMAYVVRLCLTLGVLYLGAALSSFLQSFAMTGVTQRVSGRLRSDLAAKIDRLPVAYFDTRPVGDTLSRMTNDVDTLAQSLNSAVGVAVSSIFQLVLVTAVMFATSWEMSLTAVATVPLSLVVTLLIVRISQKYFKRQQSRLGSLNAVAEESYSGLEVIRAFHAERRIEEKFEAENGALEGAMFKANVLSALTHPLMSFVSKLGYVAVCVVGGVLMSSGRGDLGMLAAFLVYINLFQSPLGQLGQIANVFQAASAASGRVFEFLSEPEEEDESGKTMRLLPENVGGEVEFRNVRFGYTPERTVLKNFNARIEAGCKVAIVGPTGAGKTTLVNLLMRFYEAEGEILIDGVPIRGLTRDNVRALFSMVLQDAWLFEGTVRENLVYGGDATDGELKRAEEAAEIRHYIEGLPEGDRTPLCEEGLSGGQKQLMTIARAMLKQAPMMILDEATSNVDTRTEASIQAAMDRLTAGKTSFVIAHRLSTIKNADLILVLKDGDIIEQGDHETLLSQNGAYAQLYHSQFAR